MVLPLCPDVCPNRGFCPMTSMIRAVGICRSFHLKMRVPFGLRTRIHSPNPCRMSSSHEGSRRPYFLAIHDDFPRSFRCGGSNRTKWNDSFGNGILRKSPTKSGLISSLRPSQRVCSSLRQSMKIVSGLFLSNQHIRLPQQASKISLSFFISIRKVRNMTCSSWPYRRRRGCPWRAAIRHGAPHRGCWGTFPRW